MNGNGYENIYEVNSVTAKEGGVLGDQDNWQEDRGWMNEDLGGKIYGRI